MVAVLSVDIIIFPSEVDLHVLATGLAPLTVVAATRACIAREACKFLDKRWVYEWLKEPLA